MHERVHELFRSLKQEQILSLIGKHLFGKNGQIRLTP